MENRIEKYRLTFFRDEVSMEVLGDILCDLCHLFQSLDYENYARTAQHNIGTAILARCGVLHESSRQQIINAFTAVMPEQDKEDGQ